MPKVKAFFLFLILESMERGVPIVTTSIGAEGIRDNINALQVADDPKSFAKCVTSLYGDCEVWIHALEKGRQVLKNHYTKEVAREILSFDMPLD